MQKCFNEKAVYLTTANCAYDAIRNDADAGLLFRAIAAVVESGRHV